MEVVLKRINNEGDYLTLTLSDISFALEINLKFSREDRGDCIEFDILENFLNGNDDRIFTTGMNLIKIEDGILLCSSDDPNRAYLSYICSNVSLTRILNFALSKRDITEYYYDDDIHRISELFMTG